MGDSEYCERAVGEGKKRGSLAEGQQRGCERRYCLPALTILVCQLDVRGDLLLVVYLSVYHVTESEMSQGALLKASGRQRVWNID